MLTEEFIRKKLEKDSNWEPDENASPKEWDLFYRVRDEVEDEGFDAATDDDWTSDYGDDYDDDSYDN